VALDVALTETDYLFTRWNEDDRKSFVDRLKEPGTSQVVRRKPKVHVELAMIMAMVSGEIPHALPFIGLSKLSCIMCRHYLRTFDEVTGQKFAIRGSHEKAYPGWSWPILPARDKELREAFLKGIRQQLRSNFDHHAERRSHSSVPDGPVWETKPTGDIEALFDAVRAHYSCSKDVFRP
jgi:hypothetical protein